MKDVILILGMHRSGTSALTRVMNLMGAALPRALLGQNASNTRGHWESELMIAEHDTLLKSLGSAWNDWRMLEWPRKGSRKDKDLRESFIQRLLGDYPNDSDVVVIKEPRICRFSTPYIETLEAEGLNVFPVLMVRNPLEVAASLQARDGITKLDALFLWLTHMLVAELASRGKPRSFVFYDDLIQSPLESIEALSKAIGRAGVVLPYKVSDVKRQIDDYVSPTLKRQSIPDEATALDPFAQGWVNDAFGALRILCENGVSNEALTKLDVVRDAYFASINPLHHALSIERARLETESNDRFVSAVKSHEAAMEKVKSDNERNWRELESKHERAWVARDSEHEKALIVFQEAHKAESEAIKEVYEVEYAALKEAHQVESEATKEAYEAESEAIKEAYEAEHAALKEAHKVETEAIKEAYEAEHAALKEAHKVETETIKEAYEAEHFAVKQAHKADSAAIKEAYEAEHAAIKEAHENEVESLHLTFSSEREALQTRVADLTAERDMAEVQAAKQMNVMRDEFGDILLGAEANAQTANMQAQRLRSDLDAVLNSTSWKLTGGIRAIMNLIKGKKTVAQLHRLDSDNPTPRLDYKAD